MDPEKFLQKISWEGFDELKKPDLMILGKHLGITVKASMRKQSIKNTIIEILVHDDIFDQALLEKRIKVESPGSFDDEAKAKEIELKKLEMEEKERLAKLEMEEKKFDLEEKERLAKLDLEEKERIAKLDLEQKRLEMDERMRKFEIEERMKLEHEKLKNKNSSDSSQKFDAAKNIRLVPQFQETEVDKFFTHFEKIAQTLEWPKKNWTLLLQSVFVGKAREIYSSLSVSQSQNYEYVKKVVLKAYELVPEAYRQRFRRARKRPEQTHVEFAREKTQLLDRWLTSKEVGESYEKFHQLILIEEFKRGVHPDVKTHLDEKVVENVHEAAVLADDYSLTHKLKFKSKPNSNHANSQAKQSNDKGESHGKSTKTSEMSGSSVSCKFCKKPGHTIDQCYKVKNKQSNLAKQTATTSSPTLCTVSVKPNISPPENSPTEKVREDFKPFVFEGSVSLDDVVKPIKIMRDTCSAQSLMLEGTLPFSEVSSTGTFALIQGIGMEIINVPLHKVNLNSNLVSGPVTVGVMPQLPVKGISLLLGNDLAGNKVVPDPIVTHVPCLDSDNGDDELYPACAVTRSMSKKLQTKASDDGEDLFPNLEDTFLTKLDDSLGQLPLSGKTNPESDRVSDSDSENIHNQNDLLGRQQLISKQKDDPDIRKLCHRALSPQEAQEIPTCFYVQDGVLMRKWRPPDAPADEDWQVIHQVVVPRVYRQDVIGIAHSGPLGGHLGVRKTSDKILKHFWWPALRKDVSKFCKSCHPCQVVGKPNQKIPKAPLKPIPAFDEPFSRVIIDCVGPLPKTKTGNEYLLTIMCASTRFPEAIPLRNIKAPSIVKALTKFFTFVGLPKSVQSDQGSNFMSRIFQEVMKQLGIEQFKSSAYHAQSQGALERYHQTLKNMIRIFCFEFERDWDEGVHMLLFAARESVQETLGFSPFELVFGHTVRGPLKLLKEKWLGEHSDSDLNLLKYVSTFKHRLKRATEIAGENLKEGQARMKTWYDKKSKERVFKPGDKVLVLFPIPGHPLQARYHGPYEIQSKVGDLNYTVKTPDRRKRTQLCHINMLKQYIERNDSGNVNPVCTVGCSSLLIRFFNHKDRYS